MSLIRGLKVDDAKGVADEHTTAMAEAMEYLAARAGYTRVHNGIAGFEPSSWPPQTQER